MFLGIYDKRGTAVLPAAFQHLVDDFSLGGARALSTIREGSLLIVSDAGPPRVPIRHDKGELVVCCSGDAYDSKHELPDRLATAHTADPDGFSPPSNGCFSFALYDVATGRLHLGNDAFGFHPLFVRQTADFCFFSNEPEPLARSFVDGPALDTDAVAEFFLFGTTLGSKTLLRGVSNLEPGTVLTLQGTSVSERKHDHLAIPVDHSLSEGEHAKIVADEFKAAVQRRADRWPNMGQSLTGGADTRLILSCLTPAQRESMVFVTHYGVEGGETWDRDVAIAAMLASRLGLEHNVELIPDAREPFDASVYRSYRERPSTPNELHGVLGGEYLGGTCVDVALFPLELINRTAVDRRMNELFSPEFIEGLEHHPHDTLREEYGRLEAENREMLFWVNVFARSFFSHLYNGSGSLRTSRWMLPYAMNLKINSPFQDAGFLRKLLAVPFDLLTGYNLYNQVFKSHFPEFNDVPTNTGLAVRTDSCLRFLHDGKEPKKDVRETARLSRKGNYCRLSDSGAAWARGIYNRSVVEPAIEHELADTAGPSVVSKLKDQYTKSLVFKSRKLFPIHELGMKWKAKQERARAATLASPIAGKMIDFEFWCDYMGVDGAQQGEARVDTPPREISAQPTP